MALVEHLRSVHLEMVGAVLGGQGLERVAALAGEAAGAPVAIVVPRLGVAIGASAAVRGYVADRLRGRPVAPPEAVSLEVPIASGDSAVGAVLLLGEAADDAAEYLSLAAVASLTELAIADARDEVERNVRGTFLEDLRERVDQEGPDVIRRGARLGTDLSRGAVGLCADINGGRPRHVAASIGADHDGALAEWLHDEDPPTRVIALLPALPGGAEATLASARRLASRLGDHSTIGLSSFHADPADAGRALQEAELVLDVVRRSGTPISQDISGGTYRLLFRVLAAHPEEVRSFYQDTIAPLVAYDSQYGSDLVGTLEAWFEHDCSASATAAAIFAHRHTVSYRLERVRELTGLNPAASEDRERLGLGLKALRIVGPELPR
jgi:sugar diacid utilization regulator